MRWGVVLIGGLMMVGCATKPAAAQAPAGNDPPPRGAPQPRAADQPMPPPGRVSETNDVYQERFPILEGQERKEAKQRAQVPVAARVEVKGNDTVVHACDALTAEEKTECPLHDRDAVVSITDVPKGARVTVKLGKVPPERLQQMFACHKSLAAARPQAPTACGFFDAHTDAEVVSRGNRIDVDFERSADPGVLREQVRTALKPK
jgi:hypothetical protein